MIKQTLLITAIIIGLSACAGNSGNDNNDNSPVQTKTATDTMTNVTNPGVGTAADDTSAKPF